MTGYLATGHILHRGSYLCYQDQGKGVVRKEGLGNDHRVPLHKPVSGRLLISHSRSCVYLSACTYEEISGS